MMKDIKVSIIIVFYSDIKKLQKCLVSLKKYPPNCNFEIIIVNNGEEKIEKKVKGIINNIVYIKSPKNVGYGAGNNLGAKHASGEYLFILNPDAYVKKNAISNLVSFLDREKSAAAVGPNLLHANNKLYKLQGTTTLTPLEGIVAHSFLNKLFPHNQISRRYYLLHVSKQKRREVGVIPGSAILIDKNAFKEIYGFDERIFMYYEEFDISKRMTDSGKKLFIIPDAEVIHDHGFDHYPHLKKYNRQSRFYYFRKHYGLLSALIVEVFARFSKNAALVVLILVVLGVLFILH